MYIIIAGCGRTGSNLATFFSEENHDVVVIDSDASHFEDLGSGFNGLTINGVPIDEDILRSAGIEKADVLIAVTNEDNMNVMISEIARDLFKVPKVITRLNDPQREKVFTQLGFSTICPTTLTIKNIKNLLLSPDKLEQHTFNGTGILFHYIKPSKHIIGKTCLDYKDGHLFALIHNGKFIFAAPELVIDGKDTLIIAEYAK